VNPFWLGVIIALIAEFSDWLYAFITFESFWARMRVFLFWLPPNITLAFAAGFLAELLQAKENKAGLGLVAIVCFVSTLALAYVLEKNGFILRRLWQTWSEAELRARGKLLYSLALVISLVPYGFLFRQSSMIKWALIVLLVVVLAECLMYNRVWDFLHATESSVVKERLERLIKALCNRCVAECPFFLDDAPNVLQLLTHSREELESGLRATDDLLQQIMRFSPLDATDRPLPGLSEDVLPPVRIKLIAKDVQTELLARLEFRRRIVHLLVGNPAAVAEAMALVGDALEPDLLAHLQRRRTQLETA
jgi:hypothetical protein